METIKIEGFILKTPYGDKDFTFSVGEMSKYGYLTVCPHSFEFTVPAEFNPIAAEVSMLEKKLDEMNDEHAHQVKVVKDRIANLLCIEYTPS